MFFAPCPTHTSLPCPTRGAVCLCQRLVGPARGGERFDGVEPNKVAWFIFSVFIYAAIVAMVVIACITTPLYQREYQLQHENDHLKWYVWTDLAFAILFTGETVIKIIADGLVSTPNAYLRSSWGFVDAVVLITCLRMLVQKVGTAHIKLGIWYGWRCHDRVVTQSV